MYGITSKTAIVAGLAGLVLSVAAFASPANADDRHYRGHGKYDNSPYRTAPKYNYKHGHGHRYGTRYGHRYWRKHGHHGVVVHAWRPVGHRPSYHSRRIHAACHRVVGHGYDHFGRRAKFGGTMCYDRYGKGYVVAGSRYVIRYF